MRREAMTEDWLLRGEQMLENQRLLDECPRHEFSPVLPLKSKGQWYRCMECGGEVDAHAYYWHQRGRATP